MSELELRRPERLDNEQIKYISGTEFIPKGLRGNLPGIMAVIATGRELGLGDMEALRSINLVDGRPALGAETMVRLVRRRGHSITGSWGDGQVTAVGRRADNGDEMTVTWTLAMAERAQLLKKDNWAKYPESMLWARAVSQLCRMLFADCLGGVIYTPDEVELTEEERIAEALPQPRVPELTGPDDSGAEDLAGNGTPGEGGEGAPEAPGMGDTGGAPLPAPEPAANWEPIPVEDDVEF